MEQSYIQQQFEKTGKYFQLGRQLEKIVDDEERYQVKKGIDYFQ